MNLMTFNIFSMFSCPVASQNIFNKVSNIIVRNTLLSINKKQRMYAHTPSDERFFGKTAKVFKSHGIRVTNKLVKIVDSIFKKPA